MIAYVAVKGCTLSFASGTGKISISSNTSETVTIDGKGVYSNVLSFTVSEYTGVVTDGTGSGVIVATATKTTDDGSPVLRLGDKVTVTITGNQGQVTGVTTTDVVTITDAGQTNMGAD